VGSRGNCLFGRLWASCLASLIGHGLDREVAICFYVVDGLYVEVVGELEMTSIWLVDGQPSMVEEMHTSMMLPGWKAKADPFFHPPDSALLAATHNGVEKGLIDV